MIPQVPYTTTINMNLDFNRPKNRVITVQDDGFADDEYRCDFTLVIDATDAAYITGVVEASEGEPIALNTLLNETTPEFYPFGPHIQMEVDDLVNVASFEDKGQRDIYGNWFVFEISITPAFDITYNNTVVDCGAGGFRFGSLINFYLPSFNPNVEDKRFAYITGNNTFVNVNQLQSSHKITPINFSNIITDGARNILLEVCRFTRATDALLNAGTNWYPFANQAGQGDRTVRLSSPVVRAVNTEANLWDVSYEVIDVTN